MASSCWLSLSRKAFEARQYWLVLAGRHASGKMRRWIRTWLRQERSRSDGDVANRGAILGESEWPVCKTRCKIAIVISSTKNQTHVVAKKQGSIELRRMSSRVSATEACQRYHPLKPVPVSTSTSSTIAGQPATGIQITPLDALAAAEWVVPAHTWKAAC